MSDPYLNHNLPIQERLDDLLSRMTIDEMIAQLKARFVHIPEVFDPILRKLDPEMRERFRNEHLSPMSWSIYQEDREVHAALLGRNTLSPTS